MIKQAPRSTLNRVLSIIVGIILITPLSILMLKLLGVYIILDIMVSLVGILGIGILVGVYQEIRRSS